jgi:N-acetylglucosamine kinase-like BadF-type ATPase
VRRPPLVVVDAGGSKIDAALVRRDGTVLGAARVVSAEHDGVGRAVHLELVADAIVAASRDAGIESDDRPVADLGVYCLAGADLPGDDRRIARWLDGRGLADATLVRNDTFAVLRAGTDRTWGVAVVCGYGTNCSGVSPDGRSFRFPAVGALSGDWGGGTDLGQAALWYAIRAEDGRGERTLLRELVPIHFGFRRVREVVEALHFGRLAEDRVVELAPLIFVAAAEDDAVARSVVNRQADEVVAMGGTAIRRLRMTDLDVDVVLGGGVFRGEDARFIERIREGFAAIAPRAMVKVLDAPPVVGAALLGLDHLAAPRAGRTRVRAALTEERLSDHALPPRRWASADPQLNGPSRPRSDRKER